MLTVFTTPKPFEGLAAVHQRNAIGSWKRLPGVEVIVFGGDREATRELGVTYIDRIPTGPGGLPYVKSLFGLAEQVAAHDLLVYANADLMLLSDLPDAVRRVADRFPRFLAVGRRWDVKLNMPLDFDLGWEGWLRDYVTAHGELHSESGKDWLAWRRPLGLDIPPLVMGRVMWDNKVVDMVLKAGIPVVDATLGVTAVHQEHGYPDGWLHDAPAEHNRALCDVPPDQGRISEATWVMTAEGNVERKQDVS